MHSNAIDMTDQQYGRFTVIGEAGRDKHGYVCWYAVCSCGVGKIVTGRYLRNGDIQSCGCLQVQQTATWHMSGRGKRHGHTTRTTQSKTWTAWNHLKQRCTNPKNDSYPNYGGRGITVCERWANSFEAFLEDMGEKPVGMSLDRIDNDKGYFKENCRWATRKEQNANRRPYRRKAAIQPVLAVAA